MDIGFTPRSELTRRLTERLSGVEQQEFKGRAFPEELIQRQTEQLPDEIQDIEAELRFSFNPRSQRIQSQLMGISGGPIVSEQGQRTEIAEVMGQPLRQHRVEDPPAQFDPSMGRQLPMLPARELALRLDPKIEEKQERAPLTPQIDPQEQQERERQRLMEEEDTDEEEEESDIMQGFRELQREQRQFDEATSGFEQALAEQIDDIKDTIRTQDARDPQIPITERKEEIKDENEGVRNLVGDKVENILTRSAELLLGVPTRFVGRQIRKHLDIVDEPIVAMGQLIRDRKKELDDGSGRVTVEEAILSMIGLERIKNENKRNSIKSAIRVSLEAPAFLLRNTISKVIFGGRPLAGLASAILTTPVSASEILTSIQPHVSEKLPTSIGIPGRLIPKFTKKSPALTLPTIRKEFSSEVPRLRTVLNIPGISHVTSEIVSRFDPSIVGSKTSVTFPEIRDALVESTEKVLKKPSVSAPLLGLTRRMKKTDVGKRVILTDVERPQPTFISQSEDFKVGTEFSKFIVEATKDELKKELEKEARSAVRERIKRTKEDPQRGLISRVLRATFNGITDLGLAVGEIVLRRSLGLGLFLRKSAFKSSRFLFNSSINGLKALTVGSEPNNILSMGLSGVLESNRFFTNKFLDLLEFTPEIIARDILGKTSSRMTKRATKKKSKLKIQAELARLSDAFLKDLGLTDSEIAAVRARAKKQLEKERKEKEEAGKPKRGPGRPKKKPEEQKGGALTLEQLKRQSREPGFLSTEIRPKPVLSAIPEEKKQAPRISPESQLLGLQLALGEPVQSGAQSLPQPLRPEESKIREEEKIPQEVLASGEPLSEIMREDEALRKELGLIPLKEFRQILKQRGDLFGRFNLTSLSLQDFLNRAKSLNINLSDSLVNSLQKLFEDSLDDAGEIKSVVNLEFGVQRIIESDLKASLAATNKSIEVQRVFAALGQAIMNVSDKIKNRIAFSNFIEDIVFGVFSRSGLSELAVSDSVSDSMSSRLDNVFGKNYDDAVNRSDLSKKEIQEIVRVFFNDIRPLINNKDIPEINSIRNEIEQKVADPRLREVLIRALRGETRRRQRFIPSTIGHIRLITETTAIVVQRNDLLRLKNRINRKLKRIGFGIKRGELDGSNVVKFGNTINDVIIDRGIMLKNPDGTATAPMIIIKGRKPSNIVAQLKALAKMLPSPKNTFIHFANTGEDQIRKEGSASIDAGQQIASRFGSLKEARMSGIDRHGSNPRSTNIGNIKVSSRGIPAMVGGGLAEHSSSYDEITIPKNATIDDIMKLATLLSKTSGQLLNENDTLILNLPASVKEILNILLKEHNKQLAGTIKLKFIPNTAISKSFISGGLSMLGRFDPNFHIVGGAIAHNTRRIHSHNQYDATDLENTHSVRRDILMTPIHQLYHPMDRIITAA